MFNPLLRALFVTLLLLPTVIPPLTLTAQVPGTISYQGQVDGASGPVDLVFRLYSSEIGGTVIWSEEHRDVPLASTNTFSVTLGRTNSLSEVPFDRPYYLEIVLDGDVLTPRTARTASPFARRAAVANGLANGSARPVSLATGGSPPADGEVLAFDAATGDFRWRTLSSGGGGGLDRLAEGEGIRIEDLLGPVPTIHIRQGGIVGSMINDTTMTDRVLKTGSITGRAVADGTLTQEKFAPGVGLPNIGTAGGDLIGNYPNPTIRDSGVRTPAIATGAVTTPKIAPDAVLTDHIKDGTIQKQDINPLAVLDVRGVEASGYLATPVLNAQGVKLSGQTRVALIQGVASTSATTALEVVDSGGAPLLKVRDDRTVGIGTATPSAALEINKPTGAGLKVTSGSTSFSFGTANAGATITLPAGTTIVRIADDSTPGSANVLSFAAPNGPGELVILINNDADPLTIPGNPSLGAGSTGMYVSLPAGAGFVQIN